MHRLSAPKGAAGGPQLRKSGGPELRKSGGTEPRKLGGSDQRKFCTSVNLRGSIPDLVQVAINIPDVAYYHAARPVFHIHTSHRKACDNVLYHTLC